jgi:leucyl-tRNA synthetase
MADKVEKAFNTDELKKKVETLKGQLKSQKEWKSAEARKLRRQLKRAQRRLTLLTPQPLDARHKRLTRQNDIIGKILSEMSKTMKKPQENAFVHSLRKKVKSLNKRTKKLDRLMKKKAPPEGAAAAPAAPAAEAPKA